MRLERILALGPSELADRTRQELRKYLERVQGWEYRVPDPETRIGDAALGLLRGKDSFFAGVRDRRTVSMLNERMPDASGDVLAAADRLMRGELDLLGYRGLCFGEPIDWHLDPVSGRRAPLLHWSRIDPLDIAQVGDSKVIWELGRHQWLVTLAQAYALSGDERYADRALSCLDAWTKASPIGYGIHWTSSLEVSYRLIAWSWLIELLRPRLGHGRLASLVRQLAVHAARIERYLSTSFSPNTHLTGEALGLFYAGVVLRDLAPSSRWLALGQRILAQEIERQVLPDGVYFEQSTCYQRYTAEIYLHFVALARRAGVALPSLVSERVRSLLDFLLRVQQPDGMLPSLGDADGGWLLPLARRRRDDPRGVFSTAAVLFGRSDYAWAARGLQPETLWMLGPGAAARFDALSPAPPDGSASRLYPFGGWAILRDSWADDAHQVILDVGPLGCPVSSGHGHADLLALHASFFGEPIVVDPGTGSYADRGWRDAFRSSLMHSTVTVDGRSQAEPAGPFSWKTRPRARLERWTSRARLDRVSACHDAFSRPGDPIVHRRQIIFAKTRGCFLLIDEVEGSGEHLIELRFQLGAGVKVERRGGWVRAMGPRGHGVELNARARAPIEVTVVEGELAPARGWTSPDYGQQEPAPQVVIAVRGQLPLRVATWMFPRQPETQSET